jgi:putative hemolysin
LRRLLQTHRDLDHPDHRRRADHPDHSDHHDPNPAAVYCEQLGGTTENRPSEGGEAGWCLKDGKECDQWALYRGECPELGPAAPEAGSATEPRPAVPAAATEPAPQ